MKDYSPPLIVSVQDHLAKILITRKARNNRSVLINGKLTADKTSAGFTQISLFSQTWSKGDDGDCDNDEIKEVPAAVT
eukprot:119504-Hanusia_phi.AAC.1